MGNVLNLPAVLNVKQSNKILHFNKKKLRLIKNTFTHLSLGELQWWTSF